MLLVNELFVAEHIDADEHSCDQENAGFRNEYGIGPETLHGSGGLANKMSFTKSPHKNAISNQSNNARNLNSSELHQHIDSVAEDNHDSHHKHSIRADSLQEKQSHEPEQQPKEDTTESFSQ